MLNVPYSQFSMEISSYFSFDGRTRATFSMLNVPYSQFSMEISSYFSFDGRVRATFSMLNTPQWLFSMNQRGKRASRMRMNWSIVNGCSAVSKVKRKF